MDKDKQIEKLNHEVDLLSQKQIKMEKTNDKLMRRIDTTEKNLAQQQFQLTSKVESLNSIITSERKDFTDLSLKLESKQKELADRNFELNEQNIKIDSLTSEIEALEHKLTSVTENSEGQRKEIERLAGKVKKNKTLKQHLERNIQQLREFKQSVDEINERKITELTEQVKVLKQVTEHVSLIFKFYVIAKGTPNCLFFINSWFVLLLSGEIASGCVVLHGL